MELNNPSRHVTTCNFYGLMAEDTMLSKILIDENV